jgi:phage tail-like protein
MRFHANCTSVGSDGINYLADPENTQAGFSAVTTPEATAEAVEYREGLDIYTQKYPGIPTMSDVTLSRGATRAVSAFWAWMRIVLEGRAEYRAATLEISHYHRDTMLTRPYPVQSDVNLVRVDVEKIPAAARIYRLNEAFPIRCKVGGDLDATASEISISELDVSYESFEIIRGPTAT